MQCASNAGCGWHASCDLSAVGVSNTTADAMGTCVAFALSTTPLGDAAMGVLSFLIAGISLAAGVGGGGLFVPLLMMMLSFDARTATALSQSMLLGGSLAAFGYNLDHRHPRAPARPLVDFELACLLAPALVAGAQVGSVVHAIAPPALLVLLLCVVLVDAARKGLANAQKISAAEKEKKKVSDTASKDKGYGQLADAEGSSASSEGSPSISSDDEESADRISHAKMLLVFMWLCILGLNYCKGVLVGLCSPPWWGLIIGSTVCLGGFACWYAHTLSSRKPVDDNCLDFRDLAFPLVRWAALAGLLAAMCGIGGGMVMGPILVGLKVPPPVSAATTATTLLILSSSMTLVYAIRGFAPKDYSIFLPIITCLGALAGKVSVGRFVKATGKESVIVWMLVGITVLSTIIMGTLGSLRAYENGAAAFALGELCQVGGPEHATIAHKHLLGHR